MQNRKERSIKRPGPVRFVAGGLAFALAGMPVGALAESEDPALDSAIRRHFGDEDPTSSPTAMVAYFTSEPPPGDVAVASRRHVDLDVKFEFDSDALDDTGIAQLDVAGEALSSPQLREHRFVVSGHTDDQGNEAYNLDLSRRRAESARSYLIEKYEIDEERLVAEGYGAERPRNEADTLAARRENRRVVLEMLH